MKTSLELQVRYKETDKMGRVYHSNYFVWLDMARTEFLREAGISYKEMEDQGIYFVVAETNCKYKSSLGFDDKVLIETWLREVKKATVEFSYQIFNKESKQLIAEAYTKLGAVDVQGKVQPIPEKILGVLKK
ncbi:acyl-CoA thioesterase [Candidatus Margulisiibacteriota bacterium]